MSFRLGEDDWDNGVGIFDPTRQVNNVALRRAMAFAVDYAELGQVLFNGLQFPAANALPPVHYALMDLSVPLFHYNPQLANQILDDAGFIDIDGDGFRENPDGSPLILRWLFTTGATDETVVPFHIQAYARIGLDVRLFGGRPLDQHYVWDMLDFSMYLGDDYDYFVDMYNAGWSNIGNPNPSGRWGPPNDWWNPSFYASEEWHAILSRISSMAAWDEEYLLDAYSAMQWYVYENAFYFPTLWAVRLSAINNRVANWDNRTGIPPQESGWHLIRLTAENPY
jgi:peptide/nickel transport system substrate-binding protein